MVSMIVIIFHYHYHIKVYHRSISFHSIPFHIIFKYLLLIFILKFVFISEDMFLVVVFFVMFNLRFEYISMFIMSYSCLIMIVVVVFLPATIANTIHNPYGHHSRHHPFRSSSFSWSWFFPISFQICCPECMASTTKKLNLWLIFTTFWYFSHRCLAIFCWMPWTYHSWSGLLSNMLAIELIVVAPSLFASTSTARSLSSAFILPLYSSRIQCYPAAPPK